VIWVALAVAVCVVTSTLGVLFLIAHKLLRTVENALMLVDVVHARDQSLLSTVQDRLMAVDFERFKSWQSVESADEGGFFTQEEQRSPDDGEVTVEKPGRWGSLGATEALEDRLKDAEVPDDRLVPPR
jgi:hypothetical protein